MRKIRIPTEIKNLASLNGLSSLAASVYIYQKHIYQRFFEPEVSILIPAFNEEDYLLKTLFSLALSNTRRNFEIIVIDNNSTDGTEKLVKATGVKYIKETVQGITAARNAGLGAARGKYILSADADTIYPPDWIDIMIKPLEDSHNSVAYGRFSFYPTPGNSRLSYCLYEHLADISRYLNKILKDEAVNVYGFNFGFRKDEALAVDWFNHPRDANEDGWMALKLRDKGFGRLFRVTDPRAMVWTSDRRILRDGGLKKGILKRLNRVILNKQETHEGLTNN